MPRENTKCFRRKVEAQFACISETKNLRSKEWPFFTRERIIRPEG